MTKNVVVLKKKYGSQGQPMFDLFVEGTNAKYSGLRKLKRDGMYSIQSYGGQNLKDNIEKSLGEKVNLSGNY